MRSAYLDDAKPEQVSHAVRELLERKGAIVIEHRHSRVRFTGLPTRHAMSWTREGYVGVYQHQGEHEAEVRLRLRARWPWRILLTVAAVNVLVAILALVLNPASTTWIVLAVLTGLALVCAGIVYVGTLKSVREEERDLLAELEQELERLPDVDVRTDEERELQLLEAELEGEITQRRLDAARPPPAPKGRRFSLRPGKAAAPQQTVEETPEERRARLLARKAELEARREREG